MRKISIHQNKIRARFLSDEHSLLAVRGFDYAKAVILHYKSVKKTRIFMILNNQHNRGYRTSWLWRDCSIAGAIEWAK
jgi:hypothetical protein